VPRGQRSTRRPFHKVSDAHVGAANIGWETEITQEIHDKFSERPRIDALGAPKPVAKRHEALRFVDNNENGSIQAIPQEDDPIREVLAIEFQAFSEDWGHDA
jgi:hypothetical protein